MCEICVRLWCIEKRMEEATLDYYYNFLGGGWAGRKFSTGLGGRINISMYKI